MASRSEVFAALVSERAYQDDKWEDLDKVNNLQDFVTYIQKYAGSFDPTWSNEQILANFRKVAALGVVAMEKFGAPQREGYKIDISVETVEEPVFLKTLSDEELQALVKQGQESTKVEFNKWYRVNEIERAYIYFHEGKSCYICVKDVRAFSVSSSGNHRLIDARGTEHFVKAGWHCLTVPKAEVL